ncbi:MAG TPA: glycosyltransferase WbuB [Eubacterium sp.]|nr:glycosyltransferase WbuB [Eubacterium sp.]
MNILFMTTGTFNSINEKSIYPDLLREFKNHNHQVYVVSSNERRLGKKTEYINEDGAHLLRVKIGNLTKTNVIEKGFSTLKIEGQYKKAIKRYLCDIKFDLIIYSTPPITLVGAINYIKNKNNAWTYLLLKDIFPQNAVDIGMIKKRGVKGFLYKYFRNKEKKLYSISDKIGCMSNANVNYVINHNPEINPLDVEVCPNCIEIIDKSISDEIKCKIRTKYNIPLNKKVFVYGGNLGKPQGVPFLIKCLEKCENLNSVFFLVVGNGTEYRRLEEYRNNSKQKNFLLMSRLPKEDYDSMVGACDVGMIFLDHRFTIPNYPSRMLSYMQAKLPILACTDSNTDIGKNIISGGFGWWCESDDENEFRNIVEIINNVSSYEFECMKKASFQYLCENYSSELSYNIIMKHMK